MKKFLMIVSILCALLLLASCSAKDMNAEEFFEGFEYEDEYPTLQSSRELKALSDLICKNTSSNDQFTLYVGDAWGALNCGILVLEDVPDDDEAMTYFYNVNTDKILSNLTVESDKLLSYDAQKIGDTVFIYVQEQLEDEDGSLVKLYKADGTFVDSEKVGSLSSIRQYYGYQNYSVDLLPFNGKIYRVDESGSLSTLVDNPFFGTLPYLVKSDNYYYSFPEIEYDDVSGEWYYNSSCEITVYDRSLNTVLYWDLPANRYDVRSVNVLSSEKILVQYLDLLPDKAKEYDIFEDTEKYDLVSIIIDVETGKEKRVDLDYLVVGVSTRGTDSNYFEGISERIDNYASLNYIEDNKILDARYVKADLDSNDASIDFLIMPEFDSVPAVIANGYYVCCDYAGDFYLYDSNFDKVAKVNDLDNSFYIDLKYHGNNNNEKYILSDDKIFDYEMNLVYYMGENDMKLAKITPPNETIPGLNGSSIVILGKNYSGLMAHNAILSKEVDGETEYYLFSDGKTVAIDGELCEIYKQYYVTKELNEKSNTYDYTYYNEYGTKLLEIEDVDANATQPKVAYSDSDMVIIVAEVDGEISYHRIEK